MKTKFYSTLLAATLLTTAIVQALTKDEGDLINAAGSSNGLAKVTELVEKKKVNVNAAKDDGVTALMMAASGGLEALPLVKYLIKKGANVNAKDNVDNSVLIWAVNGASLPVVQYLVENGADLTIKDKLGDTALSFAKNGLKSTGHKDFKPFGDTVSIVNYLSAKVAA